MFAPHGALIPRSHFRAPSVPTCLGPFALSSASAFDFDFRVAAPGELGGAFRIVAGGTGCTDYTIDLSGLVTVPSTGGWGTFTSLSA